MCVFLPYRLREYIICHELAHLTHFDHSAEFHAPLLALLRRRRHCTPRGAEELPLAGATMMIHRGPHCQSLGGKSLSASSRWKLRANAAINADMAATASDVSLVTSLWVSLSMSIP